MHFHIGSQLLDISPIHEAAAIVAKLVRELKALQIELKFFDIGGGLGVRYEKEDVEPDLYDYAQGILAQLHGLDVTIGMEPEDFWLPIVENLYALCFMKNTIKQSVLL